MQVGWRRRRAATGRKGAIHADLMIEAEPLFDKDAIVKSKATEHAHAFDNDAMIKSKEPNNIQNSPTFIAAYFNDFHFDDMPPPSIAPLTLPGAWTVVGKKGKPVAWAYEQDVHESESKTKKKKKKKKKSAQPLETEYPSPLDDINEGPSASKFIQQLDRAMRQQRKAMFSSLEAKHWLQYRKAKINRVHARDVHIAKLAMVGFPWPPWETSEGQSIETIRAPEPLKTRHAKHEDCKSDKARRLARHAAMAARCYSPEAEHLDDLPRAGGHGRKSGIHLESKLRAQAGKARASDFGIDLETVPPQASTSQKDRRVAGAKAESKAKRRNGAKSKESKSTCLTM